MVSKGNTYAKFTRAKSYGMPAVLTNSTVQVVGAFGRNPSIAAQPTAFGAAPTQASNAFTQNAGPAFGTAFGQPAAGRMIIYNIEASEGTSIAFQPCLTSYAADVLSDLYLRSKPTPLYKFVDENPSFTLQQDNLQIQKPR